jgi:NADH-quinone oxidoreductase subunit N
LCLLSLAGVPPTGGFAGRWLVLSAAIQDGFVSMAVLAALTGVVLTFACLRLVVQMYMVATPARRRPAVPRRTVAGVAALAAGLVAVGVWPGPLLDVALRSVAAIF